MTYTDGKIWDSKRGWVKPKKSKKRIIIKRVRPKLSLDSKYIEDYDKAEFNPEWDLLDNSTDCKIGYSKDETPFNILEKWSKELFAFNRRNTLLKCIPFVKVEVIE